LEKLQFQEEIVLWRFVLAAERCWPFQQGVREPSLLLVPGFTCSVRQDPNRPTRLPASVNPFLFDMPSTSVLRASKKKVFVYYFPPFPISIENAVPSQDYSAAWLDPDAKNGQYRAIGVYLRDRPIGRAPRSEKNWLQIDYQVEVQRAISIGLDGFIYGMPDHELVDQRWNRVGMMLDAAKAVDLESVRRLAVWYVSGAVVAPIAPAQCQRFRQCRRVRWRSAGNLAESSANLRLLPDGTHE
jgi:hypothetical protein